MSNVICAMLISLDITCNGCIGMCYACVGIIFVMLLWISYTCHVCVDIIYVILVCVGMSVNLSTIVDVCLGYQFNVVLLLRTFSCRAL